MASSSGLTRRRGGGGGAAGDGENDITRSSSASNIRDSAPETSFEQSENGHKIAFDPRDMSESAERSKQPKLTLMEEVLLLGLKDKQVRAPLLFEPPGLPRPRDDGMPTVTNRATSPSGMTTSRTPSAGASSWSWPSAAASACKGTHPGDDFPCPTAS